MPSTLYFHGTVHGTHGTLDGVSFLTVITTTLYNKGSSRWTQFHFVKSWKIRNTVNPIENNEHVIVE